MFENVLWNFCPKMFSEIFVQKCPILLFEEKIFWTTAMEVHIYLVYFSEYITLQFNFHFQACQFLGVEPHECIMIGDKMETDILGGVKAGLAATFLIQTSQTQPATEVKPDHVLSSVMELTHFLPKRPLMKRPTLPLVSDEDTNSNSSDGSWYVSLMSTVWKWPVMEQYVEFRKLTKLDSPEAFFRNFLNSLGSNLCNNIFILK